MDYKHSCVIDAQKLYKTFVLVMLVPTDDGAGVLDLGELGSASMTKLGQSDPALERAIGYIPGGLGKGATVYAGATDDGRVLYYALSASGVEAAIVLEDPVQEAVATYVGPRVYRDGAYHIVDDNDRGDITYTFTSSGNVSAEIQHYTLQDGEQLIDTAPPTVRPYSGAVGLVRPKWDADNNQWIEAATEEEIAAWETEHPDPNAKTLEELRADKEAEISTACNEAIVAGLDIQLPGGTTEHFDYSERDQINIKEMFDAVLMGATMYPYQSEDGSCRTYTAEEIVNIYPTLAGNKTAQLTYYHQLKDYIDTLDTAEEIEAVTYGQPLTGEYLEHYNDMVAVAAEQMQTVVARITSAMSA